MRVASTVRIAVATEDDVSVVRRRARDLAARHGFDAFAAAAITTATSELTRNVLVHGGGGFVDVEEVDREGRAGIRLVFTDQGPGISDLERALRGGFSTGRSLGLGLSGSRRLVDEFKIASNPGDGTRVEVVKWARFRR